MILRPAFGFDSLLFGMKQSDIESIYGQPSMYYKDEEDNVILVYNSLMSKLTLYADEGFRLGYIVTSKPDAELYGEKFIGQSFDSLKKRLDKKGYKSWEKEENEGVKLYFNEDFWLFIHEEYDQIFKLEIGALIKNQDDFDWKFQ